MNVWYKLVVLCKSHGQMMQRFDTEDDARKMIAKWLKDQEFWELEQRITEWAIWKHTDPEMVDCSE